MARLIRVTNSTRRAQVLENEDLPALHSRHSADPDGPTLIAVAFGNDTPGRTGSYHCQLEMTVDEAEYLANRLLSFVGELRSPPQPPALERTRDTEDAAGDEFEAQ